MRFPLAGLALSAHSVAAPPAATLHFLASEVQEDVQDCADFRMQLRLAAVDVINITSSSIVGCDPGTWPHRLPDESDVLQRLLPASGERLKLDASAQVRGPRARRFVGGLSLSVPKTVQ